MLLTFKKAKRRAAEENDKRQMATELHTDFTDLHGSLFATKEDNIEDSGPQRAPRTQPALRPEPKRKLETTENTEYAERTK